MNKLVNEPQTASFAISTASQQDPGPVRRLVVLVPLDSDYSPVLQRVWELANAQGSRVLFLGLCKDAAHEPALRRGLVTLSALVRDGRVSAEDKVGIGTNWVDFVKSNRQVGDMIVCLAEQRAGILQRPLSQILESKLDMPVYILSGLYTPGPSESHWLAQITAWVGSIGILAGTFLLQIRVVSLPQDWAQTTLLILSVVAEVWLIWVWNSLFS